MVNKAISIKTTGRIAGVLFLLSVATGIPGIFLKGLPLSFHESPKFLHTIVDSSFNIQLSILCDVIANAGLLSIAVLIFPVLKKLSNFVALWYLGFSLIAFAVIFMGDISVLSLLSLCKEYVKPGIHDAGWFQTLAAVKQDEYFGAHFMSLIVDGLSSLPFCYVLYQSKLIPRLLAGWGFIAAVLELVATWLQVFDKDVNLLFYAPNGLFVIFLALWLIIRGFDEPVIDSQ